MTPVGLPKRTPKRPPSQQGKSHVHAFAWDLNAGWPRFGSVFSARGRGEGESEAPGGGAGRFFYRKSQEGGGGRGAGRVSAANRGVAKYFFSGPRCPSSN